MANSWIYIFSKFTPEALLFEALFIFVLLCCYTAFWVLRKRRYGSVDTTIPSGPVKTYLSELIFNAEQVRLQLFGLLASNDFSASQLYRLVGQKAGDGAQDPEVIKKITILEKQVLEQQKSLEDVTQEKSRLEKELANTSAKGGAAAGKEDSGSVQKLQTKLQDLENRLAEYSVIEDDLANLKTLQQENTLLKDTLNAKGIPIPKVEDEDEDEDEEEEESTPTPEASAPAPAETKPAEASPAASSEAPPAPAADAAAPTDTKQNTELVAEFEKMLKP